MQHLAKITAVRVEVGAVRRTHQQSMITPLPDEAAVQPRIALGQLVVDLHATWTIAHGMGVLAHQERLAADPHRIIGIAEVEDETAITADGLGLQVVRIHPRIDVGVRADVIALVVHWPSGISAMHPVGHQGKVPAGPCLIAERPDDHRWVILVTLDRTRDAV